MTAVQRKFAHGSLWYAIGQGSSNLATFVIFAVLARLLGPFDFGLVAFAAIFIDLSRSLALAGLPTALVREPEWDDRTASTTFWGNLGFAVALSVIVAAGAFGVTHWLHGRYGPSLPWVISSLTACLIIDAARATHEAKLQREFKFKSLAQRTALGTIGAGIVGVALAFAGFGVWALVLNRVCSSVIQTVLVWTACRWRPAFVFDSAIFRRLFKYGMHLGASAVFGQVNRRVPELLAGVLISPVAVGFYRVGARMVNMITDLTITPLQRTAVAGFSRVKDAEALVGAYRRVTTAVALVAFPTFFGMAVVGPDLVVILFGEKWHQSGFVMSMLCLVGGVASVSYFVQPLLAVSGHSKLAASRSLFTLLTNIAVCFVTAPFGIGWLAAGFTIRAYLGLIPTLEVLKRAVGLKPARVLLDIAPPFCAATVMAATLYAARYFVMDGLNPWLRVGLIVPAGVLLYGGVLWLVFRPFIRTVWTDVAPLAAPLLKKFGRRKVPPAS